MQAHARPPPSEAGSEENLMETDQEQPSAAAVASVYADLVVRASPPSPPVVVPHRSARLSTLMASRRLIAYAPLVAGHVIARRHR